MKRLLLLLMLMPLMAFAQRTDSTISKKKIGLIDADYTKVTERDTVSYYVALTFMDARYPALQEWESVIITEQTEIDTLILNLQSAKTKIGGTVSWSIERPDYQLGVIEKGKWVAIYNSKGAYTNMTAAQVDKLVTWLKTIKIPI